MKPQGHPPNSKQEIIGNDPQRSLEELASLFKRTVQESNASQKCLALALKSVTDLKSHLEEHRSIIIESQAALSKYIPRNSNYHSFLMAVEPRWIQGTWVSFPANKEILGTAERKWNRGESQHALNELCIVQKNTARESPDWIWTILLESAILFSTGEYARAHSSASKALYECEGQLEKDPAVICELCDIAYFLYGKIYMAEKKWAEAHLEFSKVVRVREYQEKANQLMAIAYKKSNRPNREDSQYASTSRGEESTDSVDMGTTKCGDEYEESDGRADNFPFFSSLISHDDDASH